ncbi:Zinc finger MYM-type protein 1-like [Oopsacas minuta]|uniref:Zinc finger MYM-type protein 1-like n=1 Tax=Oopsacas minuta TaxID=111878 RepID=A0AAV7KDN0_9METZ|nr:Zinc finger MYM-type protein 1-like [Oopsacas minuta]
MKLENVLTSGKVDLDVISKYPELDKCSLQMQLEIFKHNYKPDTLSDAKLSYRSMTPEVRSLFPQVVVLLKLLLVCPVSSCECECSFSALRRLKTWLRATMTQHRLNCVSVCHVHCEKLDKVDVRQLARIFIV